jgi:hypothetical protein
MTMNKALVAQIRDALEASKRTTLGTPKATARVADVENALRCLATLEADEKHCNYANYETFLVHMAIHNDALRQGGALALAANCSNEGCELADALKDYVESWTAADNGNSLADDLLRAALGSVDWRELADELAEQIADENREI